ncbi:MAG: FAD-dependent monooxygenase, partial [Hyphomonadaceae bacterium]
MAQAPHNFDVLISGGGLVGLTLALALDQGGLKVAVIDRLPAADLLEETFDGRATAMGFATYRMMQSLGVASHIGEVQPIEQILVSDGRISSPSRKGGPSSLTLHFDHRETGAGDEPLGWMIENRRIRLALDKEAATRSGITRFAPDEIDDLQIGTGQVTARLKSGKVLTAPVIVGAEGRGSYVRKKAGIRTYGWAYDQTGIV